MVCDVHCYMLDNSIEKGSKLKYASQSEYNRSSYIICTLHSGRTGVGNQNYENSKTPYLHLISSIWVVMSPMFQYF